MRSWWGWESEEIQLETSFVIPGAVHWASPVPSDTLPVVMVAPPLV